MRCVLAVFVRVALAYAAWCVAWFVCFFTASMCAIRHLPLSALAALPRLPGLIFSIFDMMYVRTISGLGFNGAFTDICFVKTIYSAIPHSGNLEKSIS
jgi:hypothetical protein